jgi:hypothetical protein
MFSKEFVNINMCLCLRIAKYVKRHLKNVYNVNIIITMCTSPIEEFKEVTQIIIDAN